MLSKKIHMLSPVQSDATAELIMPGIIDSHVHLLGTGLAMLELQVNHCRDLNDLHRVVNDYLDQFTGTWVIGRGWDQNKLGFELDKRLLDSLCPERPMLMYRVCGHVVAANTQALVAAGVNRQTDDIPGGVIKRDDHGEPTGVFEERAMELFEGSIPVPKRELITSALDKAINYAHRYGITGVQTDDLEVVGDYNTLWSYYQHAIEQLPLRVQLHHRIRALSQLQEFSYIKKQQPDTEFIRVGAAKLFLDGSLGARTAALLADYSDQPDTRGVLVYEDAELREIVAFAEQHSVTLALHAIGDRAIEQALNAIAAVRGADSPGPVKHRLIHCQVTNTRQIKRMRNLGIIIEIQPGFLQTDMDWVWSRVGTDRLQTSYCWRSLAQSGLVLTGGSDAPVEDLNPWHGIATAVTRTNQAGEPARGWNRPEALDLPQALTAYTAASALLMGSDFGSVAAGKWADLAVYNDFDCDKLAANRPNRVIIAGQTVYQR
ncbi:MAG: amidohydrolase [Firmicutes bacterium]|nr:amidohydrolase [Bacillota bacterium]